MTQTIVSFATGFDYTAGALTVTDTQTRVFDSAVDPAGINWYNQLISVIQNYSGGSTGTSTTDFNNALKALNAWSQMYYVDSSGKQQTSSLVASDGTTLAGHFLYNSDNAISGVGALDTTTTMSSSMAQSLDTINRLLASFGYDDTKPVSSTNDPSVAWNAMNSAGVTSTFAATLTAAIASANTSKTVGGQSGVQEMLMTDYVDNGNTLLFNEMSQLQQAISINQSVLAYANSLQDLMNLKEPETFTLALSYLNASGGQITDASYTQFEEQSFNQTIGTDLINGISKDDLLTYCKSNQGLFQDAFKVLDTSVLPAPVLNGVVQDHDYSTLRVADNIRYLYKQISDNAAAIGDTTGALTNLKSSLNNVYKNLTTTGDLSTNPQILIPAANITSTLPAITIPANSASEETVKNTAATALITAGFTGISLSILNGTLTLTGAIPEGTNASFNTVVSTLYSISGISTVNTSAVQIPDLRLTTDLVDYQATKSYIADTLTGMSSECYSLNLTATGPSSFVVTGYVDNNLPASLASKIGQTMYLGFGYSVQFNVTVTSDPVLLTSQSLMPNTMISDATTINGVEDLTGIYKQKVASAISQNFPTFDNLSIQAASPGDTTLSLKGSLPAGSSLDALKQMLDSLTYTENGITSHITVDTTNVHVDPTVTIPTTDGVLQEAAKAAAAQKLIDQSISTVSLSLTSAGVLTISGTIPIGKTAALNTAITAIKALTGITSVVSTCSEQVPTDTLLSNLVTWIKDFSSTGTTGDFQRNLSNATTASQSFNDTERENLNRVMFIFQEFYQSASTLLSNMNDIISKMISMLTRQ